MREIPAHPDLRLESVEQPWSGRFPLQVVKFRQRRFDGAWSAQRTWELWRRGRAAAILPYDPDTDRVLLIEQFRLPALAAGMDPVLVEIPAGLCEPGEDPEPTVRREMREETGLTVGAIVPIGNFLLTPGGCDEHCALFAGRVAIPATEADGLLGGAGLAAESEDIRVRAWSATDATERAVAGLFPNSVTSLALLWLAARREQLRTDWRGTPA